MPRVIGPAEWVRLEAGIVQRVKALEMFLDDVYGEGQVLDDGVVPRRLVHSSPHFHRQVYGLRPAGGVHIHVAGIDLIRDEQGEMRVLEDNLRSPSGVSYVMENRRVMAQVFPELFRVPERGPGRRLPPPPAAGPAGLSPPRRATRGSWC